jgi:hypothetical protein
LTLILAVVSIHLAAATASHPATDDSTPTAQLLSETLRLMVFAYALNIPATKNNL